MKPKGTRKTSWKISRAEHIICSTRSSNLTSSVFYQWETASRQEAIEKINGSFIE